MDLSNLLNNGTNWKQHRYESHQQCSNPCRVMSVTTFNKYVAKNNGTLEIKLLLPRIVNVTKDVFVKTFISLGYRNRPSEFRNVFSSLHFSCWNWWLPRHDPWRKHDGSTVGLEKSAPANFGEKEIDVLRKKILCLYFILSPVVTEDWRNTMEQFV